MEKFQTIFKAGKYEPQGEFTPRDIFNIANSYDPVNFHEAPLWIGHPNIFGGEPRAFAWVKSLRANGSELQAEFSDVSPELVHMIDTKQFKRCSVELGKLDNGEYYLFAVGLTNRPAVSGLKPLEFSGRKFSESLSSGVVSFSHQDISFTRELFFSNNINHTIMFTKLIALAAKFGIQTSGITEDNAETLFADIESKFTTLNAELSTAQAELTALKTEKEGFSRQRAEDLICSAINAGKIKPADKGRFTAFALTNFDDAKAMFDAMPVDPALKQDIAGSAGASGSDYSDKFTGPDGKPLTYDSFLQFCRKDVKFADKFSDEDIAKLKAL